jgi:hypothetical protein
MVIYYEWIAPTFTIDATTNKWRSLLGVDLAAGGMWSTSDPQWPPADRGLAPGDDIMRKMALGDTHSAAGGGGIVTNSVPHYGRKWLKR